MTSYDLHTIQNVAVSVERSLRKAMGIPPTFSVAMDLAVDLIESGLILVTPTPEAPLAADSPLADWERELLDGTWTDQYGHIHAHDPLHDSRVHDALNSYSVMDEMRVGKKILAIKAVRALTGCGLKEAKEVTDDVRLYRHFDEWNKD